MESLFTTTNKLLVDWGLSKDVAEMTVGASVVLLVIISALVVNFLAKRILLRLVYRVTEKSKTTWDDTLRDRKVFERISHLAPAVVIHLSAYLMFPTQESLREIIQRITLSYMFVVVALVITALLDATVEIYRKYDASRRHPIKAYFQVVAILVYIITAILVIATLLNKSAWGLFSGLGALTAILMLVFRDSILGFAASIQLVANKMVQIGDWIEMPKYDADGDVIDVSLATIKVQNWDKTITTIPTYALISDSFKNWRAMPESGGRRIKRSICINMHSITFCNKEMIERFKTFELIKDYVTKRELEITTSNKDNSIDTSALINGRRMSNIGCFRAYIEAYLREQKGLNKKMTFLVRQLTPSEVGLPIEIYVFSSDTRWVQYEALQADIFDHILASARLFDLEIFQSPSGSDFRLLAKAKKEERN